MKNTLNCDLNRAVHLGRRDAFMERAADVFRKSRKERSGARRSQQIDATLYYLQSALDHAFMAGKNGKSLPAEDALVLVIKTMIFHLQCVMPLMENEAQLKDKESHLSRFLCGNGKSRSAKELERGSKHNLEEVMCYFRMIEAPYAELRRQLLEGMSAGDKEKYQKAAGSLIEHASARSHQRHAIRHGRTFFQAHAVRCE